MSRLNRIRANFSPDTPDEKLCSVTQCLVDAYWLLGEVDRLTTELSEAKAALKKYGSHEWDCPKRPISGYVGAYCHCGFDKALGSKA